MKRNTEIVVFRSLGWNNRNTIGKRRNEKKIMVIIIGCIGNVIGSISPLSMMIISLVNLIVQMIALIISQISTTARFVVHECGASTSDIIVPAWILPFPKLSPDLLVKVSINLSRVWFHLANWNPNLIQYYLATFPRIDLQPSISFFINLTAMNSTE